MPVILVYSGKVLRILGSNPFPFILFEPAARCKLYLSAIFVHAHADPCAALIILDNPTYLAVNPIDFINQLFTACIPWDFLILSAITSTLRFSLSLSGCVLVT